MWYFLKISSRNFTIKFKENKLNVVENLPSIQDSNNY